VLPLAYLRWIGLGCLACGFLAYAWDWMERGPYRWVKQGTPFVARICEMVVRPSMYYNGQPTSFKFYAHIEYRDHATGQLRNLWADSAELGNMPDLFTTSFRVGDYVTALSVDAKKPEDAIRLYGFLGLKPGLGVVSRDASTEYATRTRTVLAVLGSLGAFLTALFYGLQHMPLDRPSQHAFLGFFLATLASAIPLYRQLARRSREAVERVQQRNAQAAARGEALLYEHDTQLKSRRRLALETFGLMFLVFLMVFFTAASLNALLDRSPQRQEPARIEQMIHTTWNGIFRDYSIKFYRLDPKTGRKIGSEISLMSTPGHMDSFKSRAAVISVGQGFFGWSWVAGIEPYVPPAGTEEPER
jgi:hypothetical protein